MGIKNNINDVLHRTKIKLHVNYLPGVEGRYIAKTENEDVLSIERICDSLYNRGGFAGSHDSLKENVRQFMDECAFLLADGFGINLKFFSVHPNIGGTFNSENEVYDPKKNPISFKFRVHLPLQNLIKHITVEITGLADAKASIDEFIDREEDSVNTLFLPGNMFCISGNKIKIAGDDPACGVYFVPVDDPSKAVKVSRIGENDRSRITGISPDTGYVRNRIEIHTQFAGSTTNLLKQPRIIVSCFHLEATAA